MDGKNESVKGQYTLLEMTGLTPDLELDLGFNIAYCATSRCKSLLDSFELKESKYIGKKKYSNSIRFNHSF